jgi:hypothetical protein
MTSHELAGLDAHALIARTIAIDLRANSLTIEAGLLGALASSCAGSVDDETTAMMDIGTRGRLLGLDCEAVAGLPPCAITIADPEPADLAVMRSVRIPVRIMLDIPAGRLAVTIARNGADYDLAWPSGNQCWRRQTIGPDGQPAITCAVLV